VGPKQPACRKSKTVFLDCKVFNTSVEKFVEIKATAQLNFRQFNVLARIALFVCNFDVAVSPAHVCGAGYLTSSVQNWN